jgi:hypothetical protein
VRLNAADSIWKINLGMVLAENSAFVAVDCWTGMSAAVLLGVVEFTSWLRSRTDRWGAVKQRAEQLRFIAIWLVPMYLFGVVMVAPVPGHILNWFPSAVILVAFGLSRLVRRWTASVNSHRLVAVSVISFVTLVNAGVFLLPPRQTAWLRAGMPLTASDIREHDRRLDCWFQTIRANYRPEQVMICHYRQYFSWGFRLFQYHMPDYENCLLTPDRAIAPALTNKLWYAQDRRLQFEDDIDLHGRKKLLLIVPPGQTIDAFTNVFDVSQARRWDIPGCLSLYTLEPTPEQLASRGIKP